MTRFAEVGQHSPSVSTYVTHIALVIRECVQHITVVLTSCAASDLAAAQLAQAGFCVEFVIAAVVGICLIALAVFLYFYYADNTLDLLGAPVDWSDFATFFGGILGPLVLWILLFLLLYSLRQQQREMTNMVKESRNQDRLRCLQQFENDLTHLLRREFGSADGTRRVEFSDYVEGAFPFPKVPDAYFKSSLEKLLRVAANYCEAIGNYRTDLQGNFLYDIHEARARELVSRLDKLKEHFSPMARQALSFCKAHLDGKNTIVEAA